MIKAIIIDDEKGARENLKNALEIYCPQVDIIDEAFSVQSGLVAIRNTKPDLVFLDIKMEDGSGFDLLNVLPRIDFQLIFVTAFDQFALKAFRFSAIDYLLKPIHPHELIDAVNKVNANFNKENIEAQIEQLKQNIQENNNPQKLILKTNDCLHLVEINDIVYCQADKNYTTFYMLDESEIIISKTLKEYDELLNEKGFFRVHQSYLINMNHINHFNKKLGGFIHMKNKHEIPVSSRKREVFIQLLEQQA